MEKGSVASIEILRLVMSHSTLRQLAARLQDRVAALDAQDAQAKAVGAAKAVTLECERRSILSDDDEPAPAFRMQ